MSEYNTCESLHDDVDGFFKELATASSRIAEIGLRALCPLFDGDGQTLQPVEIKEGVL